MDYEKFYQRLFVPLEEKFGKIDPNTAFHIIGFDGGGAVNFNTFGRERAEAIVTYVTCELSVRPQQRPSELGRFELLTSCDEEGWAAKTLTGLGHMSMNVRLGHGHTVDIGMSVEAEDSIQGVLLEAICQPEIDGEYFCILRCIGITRPEMEYAVKHRSARLLARLKEAGVYPNTLVHRPSVINRTNEQ